MCGLDGSLYANFEKVSYLHGFDWFLGLFKIFFLEKNCIHDIHECYVCMCIYRNLIKSVC